MTDEHREQLDKILRVFFEDLPEWKYDLMLCKLEQIEHLETKCVAERS